MSKHTHSVPDDRRGPLGNHKNNLSVGGPHGESRAAIRRELLRLQEAAKCYAGADAPKGLRGCGCQVRRARDPDTGRVRPLPTVEIRRGASGSCHFAQLVRCGNVWSCPPCALWQGEWRAARLRELVDAHLQAGGHVYHLTLTIRHSRRERLERLRRGIATAWTQTQAGRPWIQLRERIGMAGTVRALEITHGPNGWHPHLHVLLFVFRPFDASALDLLRSDLYHRWSKCVERAGLRPPREFRPRSREPLGVHLTPIEDASSGAYLAKFGIAAEVALGAKKRGRPGHRTPFEILRDIAGPDPLPADIRLWAEWCAGMRGARQLTVAGRELKSRYGSIISRLTKPRSEDRALKPAPVVVTTIPARTFVTLAHVDGWRACLLELAERHGKTVVDQFANHCMRARDEKDALRGLIARYGALPPPEAVSSSGRRSGTVPPDQIQPGEGR